MTVLIIHKCLSPGAIVILLYQTLEQYPTKHRYTAVAVAVIAIKISTLLTSFTQEYLVSLVCNVVTVFYFPFDREMSKSEKRCINENIFTIVKQE